MSHKMSKIPQPVACGQPIFPVRPGSVLHQLIDFNSEASSRRPGIVSGSGANVDNSTPPPSHKRNTSKSPTRQRNASRSSTPAPSPQQSHCRSNAWTQNVSQAFEKSLRHYQSAPNSRVTSPSPSRIGRPTATLTSEARAQLSRSKQGEKTIKYKKFRSTSTRPPISPRSPMSPTNQYEGGRQSPKQMQSVQLAPHTRSSEMLRLRTANLAYSCKYSNPTPTSRPNVGLYSGCQMSATQPPQKYLDFNLKDAFQHEHRHNQSRMLSTHAVQGIERTPTKVCQALRDSSGRTICDCVHEEKACQVLSAELLHRRKRRNKVGNSTNFVQTEKIEKCLNCDEFLSQSKLSEERCCNLQLVLEEQKALLDALSSRNETLEQKLFETSERVLELESRRKFGILQPENETNTDLKPGDFYTSSSSDGKEIQKELLGEMKFPLENFISSNFPFIVENNGENQANQGNGRDYNLSLKNAVVKLAVREGLLNHLKAELKRGNKVLQKRFEKLQKLIENPTIPPEGESDPFPLTETDVLKSYQRFVRYIHTYLNGSLKDIRKFDETKFGSNEDSEQYYETTISVNGISRCGIFIPFSFGAGDCTVESDNNLQEIEQEEVDVLIALEGENMDTDYPKEVDAEISAPSKEVELLETENIIQDFHVMDEPVKDEPSKDEIETLFRNWKGDGAERLISIGSSISEFAEFPSQTQTQTMYGIYAVDGIKYGKIVDNLNEVLESGGPGPEPTNNEAGSTEAPENDHEVAAATLVEENGVSVPERPQDDRIINDSQNNLEECLESQEPLLLDLKAAESIQDMSLEASGKKSETSQNSTLGSIISENFISFSVATIPEKLEDSLNNVEFDKPLEDEMEVETISSITPPDEPSEIFPTPEIYPSDDLITQQRSPIAAAKMWIDRHPSPITTCILDKDSISKFFDPAYDLPAPPPPLVEAEDQQVSVAVVTKTEECSMEDGECQGTERESSDAQISSLVDCLLMDHLNGDVVQDSMMEMEELLGNSEGESQMHPCK